MEQSKLLSDPAQISNRFLDINKTKNCPYMREEGNLFSGHLNLKKNIEKQHFYFYFVIIQNIV